MAAPLLYAYRQIWFNFFLCQFLRYKELPIISKQVLSFYRRQGSNIQCSWKCTDIFIQTMKNIAQISTNLTNYKIPATLLTHPKHRQNRNKINWHTITFRITPLIWPSHIRCRWRLCTYFFLWGWHVYASLHTLRFFTKSLRLWLVFCCQLALLLICISFAVWVCSWFGQLIVQPRCFHDVVHQKIRSGRVLKMVRANLFAFANHTHNKGHSCLCVCEGVICDFRWCAWCGGLPPTPLF